MPPSPSHQIPWQDYEAWARQQWSLKHGPGTGDQVQQQDLAAAAGYGPHRLVKQKRKDAVPLYAVRDLARGLEADPIAALSHFTVLPMPSTPPAPHEWLTQITPAELHTELARRLNHPTPTPTPATDTHLPGPGPWATALLDGPRGHPRSQRRKHAATLLQIPYPTLRTKERRGSWTVPELVQLCEWAGWHLGLALAVTDWLTWEEVGLDPGERYPALQAVDTVQLVDAVEAGLPELRRTFESTE